MKTIICQDRLGTSALKLWKPALQRGRPPLPPMRWARANPSRRPPALPRWCVRTSFVHCRILNSEFPKHLRTLFPERCAAGSVYPPNAPFVKDGEIFLYYSYGNELHGNPPRHGMPVESGIGCGNGLFGLHCCLAETDDLPRQARDKQKPLKKKRRGPQACQDSARPARLHQAAAGRRGGGGCADHSASDDPPC